jgi:hypothetical protein
MKHQLLLNNVLITVVIILIIYCSITVYKEKMEALEMRRSSLNGKMYGIQEMLPEAHRTADEIARVEKYIDRLITYLDNKYQSGRDRRVDRLVNRLHNIRLEESPFEHDTSSYTLNKGELIAVCLRNKEDKGFHDFELLKFVIIHELAHVASVSTGHNQEFIDNFKWLLQEAHDAGMYHPVDYSKNPVTYCGVDVTNNPML